MNRNKSSGIDYQCDNNNFHNQKYYETSVIDSGSPHLNGKCKFRHCEAPSVVDGFCPFHYNIVYQHESRYLLKNIAYLLNDMHRILRHFEYHICPPSPKCTCTCCNTNTESQNGE